MGSFTDWLVGGSAKTYENPYAGAINSDINFLRNANVGAQQAQQTGSTITRRLNERVRMLRNTPGFGRNAAVMSKLTNLAGEEADNATASANIQGAQVDTNNRFQAAQLAQKQAEMDFAVNRENQAREDASGFGNSFLGGLLTSAVSYGTGSLVSGGIQSLFGGGGSGDSGDMGGGNAGTWNPWQ